jgi:transposase
MISGLIFPYVGGHLCEAPAGVGRCSMSKTRRDFTPEFKREAVALLESSGRPLMQIATELGISPSMLRNWRAVVKGGPPRSRAGSSPPTPSASPMASPADQAAEIARLRRELDRTRMERDVLKKAIGIFAEMPK